MYSVALEDGAGLDAFRAIARRALALQVPPAELVWDVGAPGLLPPLPAGDGAEITVPRLFGALAADVACHRDPQRFAVLYELLWRLKHGEAHVLDQAADPAVARAQAMAHAVRHEVHRLHAFLRFEAQEIDGDEVLVGWFEPDHHILRRGVPFFVDRLAQKRWVIATPEGSAAWDGSRLTFGPPGPRPEQGGDRTVDLWRAYYRSTFNPARLNAALTTREMPRRYWRNMPETADIAGLADAAQRRVETMIDAGAGQEPRFASRVVVPTRSAPMPQSDLAAVAAEAKACTRCPLYAPATQTVFGEGPEDAPVVFVGEQPGDQEDLAGRPFVGPAGKLFDRALAEAGLRRDRAYVTNAVKHFKFVPRGQRRIHQKPNAGEVRACRWWVEQELALVKPRLVVALGATAATALLGQAGSISALRGRDLTLAGLPGLVTVHPSYLLRLPDKAAAEREFGRFVDDLRAVGTRVPEVTRAFAPAG